MKIISGMHRSGTSLIARLFYEAGADLGDSKQFYRPDRWNPDGYFEQPDIHAINIPLINGPWWKFAYFRLPSNKTISKRGKSFANQINKTCDRYQSKIVKETRFCLTLPAWLKYGAGGQIDKIIVCLREPIQVASSIRKRNFIPTKYALNLWYVHNKRLLENTREIPLWFIKYHNIVNEKLFLKEMKNAFNFFGYDFSDNELEELRKKCVKPKMNHFNVEMAGSYPHKIEKLWKELLRRHENQF